MKEGWRIRMFGLFSKGRVRQCQLYLEETHAETHVCDSENSIKRDAGCFGTNIPSLDKHTHMTKGWWPAVTLVLWRLLCHGGWGQENDSPDTNWHATGKASLTNTSSPPSVPLSLCFPSELSQETTTSCCVPKLTIYFQSLLFKQWRTDKMENRSPPPILSVCRVNSQILYGFYCQDRFKIC